MKIFAGSILLVLYLTVGACAQGTLYFSNISQPTSGVIATGSDTWLAQPFITGNSPGGYFLNSVQLSMGAAAGNPSGFTVSIYGYSGRFPSVSLGSLTGPNPSTAGVQTFSASGITLSSATPYWIVMTSSTPVGNGAYNWNFASNTNSFSTDNWSMRLGASYYFAYSSDGINWLNNNNNPFQFAINATAVPEPATTSLIIIGLAVCGLYRRKA
jgi:hypothetical protein